MELKSIPAILALALAPFYLGAQPTSPGSPKPPPAAQVRIWFAVAPDQPPPEDGVAPVLKTRYELWRAGTQPALLASCVRPYACQGFSSLPPGNLPLSLRRLGDTPGEIATSSLSLQAGGWYTVIVRVRGSKTEFFSWQDRMEKPPAKPGEAPPAPPPSTIPVGVASLLDEVSAKISVGKSGRAVDWNSGMEPGKVVAEVAKGVHEIRVEGTRGTKPFRQTLYLEAFSGDRPVLLLTEDIYGRTMVSLIPLPPLPE